MKFVSPFFSIRSGRDYVNTADIYESVIDGLSDIGQPPVEGPISFIMREKITGQADICYGVTGNHEAAFEEAPVQFTIHSNEKKISGYLRPTDQAIEWNVQYDQQPIYDAIEMRDDKIWVTSECGFTPIEVMTTLALKLHETLLPSNGKGKWYVVRIDLRRPFKPTDTENLTVQFQRSLGKLLTRSSVLISDECIGTICFSFVAS